MIIKLGSGWWLYLIHWLPQTLIIFCEVFGVLFYWNVTRNLCLYLYIWKVPVTDSASNFESLMRLVLIYPTLNLWAVFMYARDRQILCSILKKRITQQYSLLSHNCLKNISSPCYFFALHLGKIKLFCNFYHYPIPYRDCITAYITYMLVALLYYLLILIVMAHK